MWESAFGGVFSLLVTQIGDLKFLNKKGHWSRCLEALPHAHVRTQMFLCVIGCRVSPPPGIAGKVSLPVSTQRSPAERTSSGMLSAADERGHRGSRLHSPLIVLEALICQGSAGNQVGIYSAPLCLLAGSFRVDDVFALCPLCSTILPPPREDALMIKPFLVCLCWSAWRWAHPPYLLVSPSFSVLFD